MRRREFIAIVAAAATWPSESRALQSGRTYYIAVLASFPADRSIGIVVNPTPYSDLDIRGAKEAAGALGEGLAATEAGAENESGIAFATLVRQQAGSVIVAGTLCVCQPPRKPSRIGRPLPNTGRSAHVAKPSLRAV